MSSRPVTCVDIVGLSMMSASARLLAVRLARDYSSAFFIGQGNTSGFGRRLSEEPSGRPCPRRQSTRARKFPGSL